MSNGPHIDDAPELDETLNRSGHICRIESGSENTGDLVPVDIQILTEAE
jgi:hypothetical protein